MDSSKLPAGLIDNNIEFFEHKGEPFVLQDSKVTPYEQSTLGRAAIQKDMMSNVELIAKLSKHGYHGIELEEKWVLCRFGGFNNVPDFISSTSRINIEYHYCRERIKCELSGIVCKLPEGPGGKLSHKEIETIQAIASGEPSKLAAERIGVKFNTIRAYLKSIHKKISAHSRADVMNFAYRNHIL